MPYDNRAREARARQTRAAVIDAARESFLEHGYAATTINGVAQAAGVSQETIYKTFRNKAALLKAVYDVALAGDGEPVAMAQRPEFTAMIEAAGPRESARAYGILAGLLAVRTGPLLQLVLTSRGSHPDLEAFSAVIDQERLIGATMTVKNWDAKGWLQPQMPADHARDILWTLNSPAVHGLLVSRGWTADEYAGWLGATLLTSILQG